MTVRRRWSPTAEAKLRKHYATMPWPQLCFQLKRSEAAITHHARKLGLTRGSAWTAAEIRAVKKRYPREVTEAIARDLGRDARSVYNMAHRLGLRKTMKFLASDAYKAPARERALTDPRVIAGRFQKGQVPPNKGLRRPGWAPGRMATTQFKKGAMAGAAQHNYKPMGSTRIVYGNLERKVTDDPNVYPAARWKPVHRLVWEAAHGPVPRGYLVVFKPGRHTIVEKEITLDRIELIDRAENCRRNSYHTNYPKDVALAIQAKGALTRAINRARREAEETRHDG